MLTKTGNGVLEYLKKAVQDGNAEYLAGTLSSLDSGDLYNILMEEGKLTIIESLQKSPEHLVEVSSRLYSYNLLAILKDPTSEALKFLKQNTEHLVTVLGKLNFNDLQDLLADK